MEALLEIILPVFLVIGFGYLAVWREWLSEAGLEGVQKFTQNFAIPCLLFSAIREPRPRCELRSGRFSFPSTPAPSWGLWPALEGHA